jgi:UDP-N-acetylglucosamine 4,6-dehydratase
MKMTDLAKTMAPHLPIRVVGIRPGEKLHEMLITEDEARSTYELSDRYVVEPTLAFWCRLDIEEEIRQMPEDFYFASNTNVESLTAEQLQRMIDAD